MKTTQNGGSEVARCFSPRSNDSHDSLRGLKHRATGTTLAALLLVAGLAFARANEPNLPPPYAPREKVSGTIRIWGHGAFAGRVDFMEALVREWEDGFRRQQPGVNFENNLTGTASAIGALCAGVGDLALMGREIWPYEITAFREVFGYAPTGLDVLTGSLATRNRDFALVVFVHKTNPLTGLTLRQLDAVFSADRRRGGPPARTWGDLGLGGEWRGRPLALYGWPIARGFGEFFEDVVFAGGHKWNPALKEFPDSPGTTGGTGDGGHKSLVTLARDPSGIAISSLLYANPDVKPLALAADDGGPFVAPTRETVLDHRYPLTRIVTIFLNKKPGAPTDPKLAEFLRYVLSREAQAAVADKGAGYLPMLAPFAERELKKLQ